MTNEALAARNAAKLAEVSPCIRAKVAAVLHDLQGHGYRPRIQQAWRSASEQAQNVATGHSKVSWSYHMASTKDGKADALACDLLDDDEPTEEKSTRFHLLLAASARAHGLNTGTLWDLTAKQQDIVNAALAEKAWDRNVRLGWDAGHVEVKGVTLAEAKKGKRPPVA